MGVSDQEQATPQCFHCSIPYLLLSTSKPRGTFRECPSVGGTTKRQSSRSLTRVPKILRLISPIGQLPSYLSQEAPLPSFIALTVGNVSRRFNWASFSAGFHSVIDGATLDQHSFNELTPSAYSVGHDPASRLYTPLKPHNPIK